MDMIPILAERDLTVKEKWQEAERRGMDLVSSGRAQRLVSLLK